MELYEMFIQSLKRAVEGEGNLNRIAEKSGIKYPTLYRWLQGQQVPNLKAIEPLLPYLDLGWKTPKTGNEPEKQPLKEVESLNSVIESQKTEIIRLQAQVDILREMLTEKDREKNRMDTALKVG